MLSYINKYLISNSKPTSFTDETLDTFLLSHFCAFSYLSSIHSMQEGIHFRKVEIILFIGDSLYTKNTNKFQIYKTCRINKNLAKWLDTS